MRRSIHFRLLMAATLVLVAFLGLAGIAVERAYHSSSRQALREGLLASVYSLLAAAQEDERGGMRLPEVLPDPRFNRPDSGRVATVTALNGDYRWRSASALGRRLAWPSASLEPGRPVYGRLKDAEGHRYALIQFAIVWELDGGERRYLISVAEDMAGFDAEQSAFRRTLWLWLAGVALVLLLAQGVVLRWGLRPLRQVANALREVEAGRAERLDGDYPVELRGLTDNINSFIDQSTRRQTRYRHSLDDLAHSLKTPMAVLQGALERQDTGCEELRRTAAEQLARMQAIVGRQLQRAAASGGRVLAKPVAVRPVVERLIASLRKVYHQRRLEVALEVPETGAFRGDQTDLMEILGNLLDNAFKHARRQVRIRAYTKDGGLEVTVEDDGPGIPAEMREAVLQRGTRGDESVAGQGIGLATVREIVSAYNARLVLTDSPLGGTRIVIHWPPARTH